MAAMIRQSMARACLTGDSTILRRRPLTPWLTVTPIPRKHNLFTLHSRHWAENRYVYPVISRRSRGLSVGVNLNPDKVCNFDCIYCCVDRRDPNYARNVPPELREVDMAVLAEELDHLLALAAAGAIWEKPPFDQTPQALRRINDVAFSGDGEPTSFKQFGEACRLAAELIERHGLRGQGAPGNGRNEATKIVVITNATLFHRPAVKDALAFLDAHDGEIWAKLDAGSEAYYHLVERTAIPFSRVLENILEAGRARPIVIQSLFMHVDGVAPDAAEIDAYIARLRDLLEGGCRIKLVQVYTVARGPAEAYVTPLRDEQVDAIVEKVRALGLSAQGYYGPT